MQNMPHYYQEAEYLEKNIKAIEIRFDIVKDSGDSFYLYSCGVLVCNIYKSWLSDKQITKLYSFSKPEK